MAATIRVPIRSGKISDGSRARTVKYRRTARGASLSAARHMAIAGYGSLSGGRMPKGELKVVDNIDVVGECSSTGATITALNLCAQGDDIGNRVGRQINMKSVQIRGIIKPATAGSNNASLVRVVLLYDRQPQPTVGLPASTDILTTASSYGMVNLDNRERFTVLRDSTFALGNSVAATGYAESPNIACVDMYVKLAGARTTYNTTAGTIAAVSTGSLLLLCIGDQTHASGAYFVCEFSSRLRFYDS